MHQQSTPMIYTKASAYIVRPTADHTECAVLDVTTKHHQKLTKGARVLQRVECACTTATSARSDGSCCRQAI